MQYIEKTGKLEKLFFSGERFISYEEIVRFGSTNARFVGSRF